jgi:peptidoglycan/xylan/chitin deacetylase (PgdA/CDA1 family)
MPASSLSVLDLHDKRVTLEALPTIIEKLRGRGLHFVVLGQEMPATPANNSSAQHG